MELALTLPFLCVLLLGAGQVAVVARDRLAVQLAAREAARAASVSADHAAARLAAERAVALRPLRVVIEDGPHTVRVTVTYIDPTDVAVVGAALPPVPVSATVSMATEPPGGAG
ncbi:MAG: pilus assembly protein [Actinobacteria bacterium]|nr:pilus assembly protein [Actinomycetota bacterium]